MTSPSRPRRRRVIALLVALALLVVVGAVALIWGPAFYRDVIVGEQPAAPSVPSDGATPSAGAAVSDLTGTWAVADGSFAGYRVDEVLAGEDVTVVGRTEEVSGTAVIDGLALQQAEFTVDVASIATDAAERDAYFRDQALSTDEYPEASFRLTQPVAVTGPVAGGTAAFDAAGELTLRGVTQAVTVPIEAVSDGERIHVAGSIPITFADYGVTAPNLGFVSVEPEGFVEFQLVFERS
ncbi:YceI family protein [Microbacterium sediminis]|uniref:Polyisoprenoid-binding protein n=1 Tax=Microbacterium sediminis TaxID=904291 RepID=A0A1B9N855_9MICO|nr:YceI family protein [Microbacterium sediminis]OCG72785.1 polyisoprenoid-binding protein [Microbacterium sediminis]QBR73543.1 YceI family protein [Microbacterium sediminis]